MKKNRTNKMMLFLKSTADRLLRGQQVKLRHSKALFNCVETCAENREGYACVAVGNHKLWISPGSKVLIPLQDDPVLGGAAS